jgi:hypothetical protein
MLDSRWTTLHGTVRQWIHHGRVRRRMEDGGAGVSMLVLAGPEGADVQRNVSERESD